MKDLVVVGLVVALGATVLLVVKSRLNERSHRTLCFNQLRALGSCFFVYENENRGALPRTNFKSGDVVIPTWGTGAHAPDPFGPGGPEPNDVSAALFLIIRTQDVTTEVFTCPSSAASRWDFGGGGQTSLNWSNWPGVDGVRRHLSYSYSNPYLDVGAVNSFFLLRHNDGFARPLMADINPGNGAADNSRNHRGAGQNVLYMDGHVQWQTTPFCGINGDNVYTRRSGTPVVRNSPYDSDDSVLLPNEK